jgi:hypothetical protein
MTDARKLTRRDTWTQRLMAWLFREDDAAAARHGWQIEAGPGSRSRVYRDPRFDRFTRCAACGGTGTECPECRGTGRVVLDQRSSRQTGQPR